MSHRIRVALRLSICGVVALTVIGISASSASAVSELSIEPEAVDFGVLLPGRDDQRSFTVRNLGPDPVAFGEIYLVGDVDPFYFAGGSCPETGTFEGECQLTLEFAPDAPGDFEALLVVEGGPDDEPAIAALSARSRPSGQLVPSMSAVDFGLVPVGTTSGPRTIRLSNDGGAPIRMGVVYGNGMAVWSGGCGMGVVVAPLGSCDISVSFRPYVGTVASESARQTGELAIRAEVLDQHPPREITLKIPVTGTAASSQGTAFPTLAVLAKGIDDDLSRMARAAIRLVRGGGRAPKLPELRRAPFGLMGIELRAKVAKRWIPLGAASTVVQPGEPTQLRLRWKTSRKQLLKRHKSVLVEAVARYRAYDRTIKEAAHVRVSVPTSKTSKERAKRRRR